MINTPPENPLIPIVGYYDASLKGMSPTINKKLFQQPAFLIDVDVDLYMSAIQSLDWVFQHRLVRVGTLVLFDDWSTGDVKGGEPRAWNELQKKYQVEYKLMWPVGSHCVDTYKSCHTRRIFIITAIRAFEQDK